VTAAPTIVRRSFRAMGTDHELLLEAEPGRRSDRALDAAREEVDRLEALLSRFRVGSELSRLNHAGRIDASPDLLRCVRLALEARDRTGGRFDPTVHDAVVAAGYDRSFEQIDEDGAFDRGASCGGGCSIDGATIVLAPSTRLDLGGIGKGYAADRAAELLALAGPCLVNATANGELTLELSRGGLATSGRDRRHWKRAGCDRHHLIDPATGEPSTSDLLRVTAVGASAAEAEVHAKALFLAGAAPASREADARGIPAVLVTQDGRTLLTGGLG
jgi:FAD:protein FMN transferase